MSFDLTIGDKGKVLQLALTDINESTSPPTTIPLDLTNVSTVILQFAIGNIFTETVKEVSMSIIGPPTNGLVQYIFQPADLVPPGDFNQTGQLQFTVKVVYNNGNVLYSGDISTLTIKEKVGT